MQLGVYRHYKGHDYLAILLARDCNNSADHEPCVIYISLDDPFTGCINVRRLAEFTQDVHLDDGTTVARFTYLGPGPRSLYRNNSEAQ